MEAEDNNQSILERLIKEPERLDGFIDWALARQNVHDADSIERIRARIKLAIGSDKNAEIDKRIDELLDQKVEQLRAAKEDATPPHSSDGGNSSKAADTVDSPTPSDSPVEAVSPVSKPRDVLSRLQESAPPHPKESSDWQLRKPDGKPVTEPPAMPDEQEPATLASDEAEPDEIDNDGPEVVEQDVLSAEDEAEIDHAAIARELSGQDRGRKFIGLLIALVLIGGGIAAALNFDTLKRLAAEFSDPATAPSGGRVPNPVIAARESPATTADNTQPSAPADEPDPVLAEQVRTIRLIQLSLNKYAETASAYPSTDGKFAQVQELIKHLESKGFTEIVSSDAPIEKISYISDGKSFKLIAAGTGDCHLARRNFPNMIDPKRSFGEVDCYAYGAWTPSAKDW